MARIRKNYNSLTKAEQNRYWDAFKMLSIMAADDPVRNQFADTNTPRTIYINGREYQCQSKFDQIVSAHYSCCEHRTNFFGHFHRNYLNYFQVCINKADRILRKLDNTSPLLTKQNQLLEKAKNDYLNNIQIIKAENGGKIPDISIPAWDVLNPDKQIKIPQILRSQRVQTPLQKLYYQCTGAPLGYFNPFRHWYKQYNDDNKYRFYRSFIGGNLNKNNFINMLESNISLHKDIYQIIYNGKQLTEKQLRDDYKYKYYIRNYRHNYQAQLLIKKEYISMNPVSDQQLTYLYGNGRFSYENINKIQQTQSDPLSDTSQRFKFNKDRIGFSYALSVLNPDFFSGSFDHDDKNQTVSYRQQTGFLTTHGFRNNTVQTFQNIHNYMHDCCLFPMQMQMSIMNPIFYMYHSTIDMMLELKLRMIEIDYKFQNVQLNIYDSVKSHALSELQQFFGLKASSQILKQFRAFRQDQYRYHRKFLLEKGKDIQLKDIKYYDWFKTKVYNSWRQKYDQNCFCDKGVTYYQLMVQGEGKNKHLRLSNNLNQYYNSEKSRFKDIRPDSEYDWNYDYEQIKSEGKSFKLPEYLKNIIDFLAKYIQRNKEDILSQAYLQNHIMNEKFLRMQVQKVQTQAIKFESEEHKILSRHKQQAIQLTKLLYHVQYLSSMSSRTQTFFLRILKTQGLNKNILKILENYNGIYPLFNVSFFTKGDSAENCPRCKEYKNQILYFSQKLTDSLRPLLFHLIRLTKPGILFKNINLPHQTQTPLDQILKIQCSDQFSVKNIKGANQIDFDLILCEDLPKGLFSDKLDYGQYVPLAKNYLWHFQIEGQNYCIQEPKKISRTTYSKTSSQKNNTHYYFPSIQIYDEGQTKHNAYKGFKGQIRMKRPDHDQIRCKFEFEIKNTRINCSYNIFVSSKGEIVVISKDIERNQLLLECIQKVYNC